MWRCFPNGHAGVVVQNGVQTTIAESRGPGDSILLVKCLGAGAVVFLLIYRLRIASKRVKTNRILVWEAGELAKGKLPQTKTARGESSVATPSKWAAVSPRPQAPAPPMQDAYNGMALGGAEPGPHALVPGGSFNDAPSAGGRSSRTRPVGPLRPELYAEAKLACATLSGLVFLPDHAPLTARCKHELGHAFVCVRSR